MFVSQNDNFTLLFHFKPTYETFYLNQIQSFISLIHSLFLSLNKFKLLSSGKDNSQMAKKNLKIKNVNKAKRTKSILNPSLVFSFGTTEAAVARTSSYSVDQAKLLPHKKCHNHDF